MDLIVITLAVITPALCFWLGWKMREFFEHTALQ